MNVARAKTLALEEKPVGEQLTIMGFLDNLARAAELRSHAA